MIDLRGRIWFFARVGLLSLTCLGYALQGAPMAAPPDGAVGVLLQGGAAAVVTLVMLMILIGIQAVNPRSGSSWEYPRWTDSFLDFSKPLRFFHFGAWYFAAVAVGAAIGWFARGVENLWLVSSASGAAAGTWLGVNAAWRAYKWKHQAGSAKVVGRRPTRRCS